MYEFLHDAMIRVLMALGIYLLIVFVMALFFFDWNP